MTAVTHLYEANIKWIGEKKGEIRFEGKPPLPVATPPEFGGHEGFVSPEDLFVGAAVTCFMSTFLAMALKVRADFKSFACRGQGKLEQIEGQGLLFTRIDLYPKVGIGAVEDEAKVRKSLELAKKYCLVTNSMKTEVLVNPEVTVE